MGLLTVWFTLLVHTTNFTIDSFYKVQCSLAIEGYLFTFLHQNLQIISDIHFENNIATAGGGIFSNHSVMAFIKSRVSFNNNLAKTSSGAIFLSNSRIHCRDTSVIKFVNNSATLGGAVHSTNHSQVSFKGNCLLTFENNKA